MAEWLPARIGDFVLIKHGYAFSGTHITDEPTENILVTPGSFNIGGGFKSTKTKYYNGYVPEEYILKANDIIVTMTDLSKESDTLGYSARVPASKNTERYLHNQRIGLIQFIQSEQQSIVPDFLYWLMRTDDYQAFIVGSASGSSVMHTSPSRIREYGFLLPHPKEQKAIAAVLSSLDDKIDLLHRQNKTLEAMAETLFRQWFVEEAQEDWEEKSLLELVELVGGGTPKTSMSEYWDGDIFWLSGGDISTNHKGFVSASEKSISRAGLDNSSAKLLPKFATVISARGTVGKYCLLASEMAFSQSNYGILPRFKNCFFFTYLLVNYVVEELQSAAYGSVFDTITTSTFRDATFATPPMEKVLEFEGFIAKYFDKKLLNQSQIRTLEKLRDTLLPKLMSGEVRVALDA